MISLRDGGLVAAFFGARAGPGLALAPRSRGPGLALAPGSPRAHQKNAATNPPSRREIIDDSSIFGQSFNQPQMTAAGIKDANNGVRQLKVAPVGSCRSILIALTTQV